MLLFFVNLYTLHLIRNLKMGGIFLHIHIFVTDLNLGPQTCKLNWEWVYFWKAGAIMNTRPSLDSNITFYGNVASILNQPYMGMFRSRIMQIGTNLEPNNWPRSWGRRSWIVIGALLSVWFLIARGMSSLLDHLCSWRQSINIKNVVWKLIGSFSLVTVQGVYCLL